MSVFTIVLVVILCVALVFDILYYINSKIMNPDARWEGIICLAIAIIVTAGISLGVTSIVNTPNDSTITPTVEDYCTEHSISYTLVSTIAEYTGDDEQYIANVINACAGVDMDLDEAIMLTNPALTEKEASAILIWSDNKQLRETSPQDATEPAAAQ